MELLRQSHGGSQDPLLAEAPLDRAHAAQELLRIEFTLFLGSWLSESDEHRSNIKFK